MAIITGFNIISISERLPYNHKPNTIQNENEIFQELSIVENSTCHKLGTNMP